MENEIYNYTEYLFAFALSKCKNLHDAEDLTQDTLLAAYQYIHKGKEIRNMKYWLTSTLLHKWNDMLRKKYKFPTVSIDMISPGVEEDISPDTISDFEVMKSTHYGKKTFVNVLLYKGGEEE